MKRSSLRLVGWMLLAVAAVAAIAYWDEERESAAALDDFGREQVALSQSVASDLATRFSVDRDHPALAAAASRIEHPGSVVLLFYTPDHRLLTRDGKEIGDPVLAAAFDAGKSVLRLSREEAAWLSLPARTALAGLTRISAVPQGQWGVAVVASAGRERDREQRARWRLVLAVALAAGLVVSFGGQALKRQRKELELERELAIAELARDRDERLERLSKAATMITLASGMAHELSTPLGAIVGRAEQLLPKMAGDERGTRAVQTILEQGERMSQVIRGFLNLARGGAPTLERVEPKAIVDSALGLVEHRFEKAGVTLSSDVPAELPTIRCDLRLLEHALVNLLLNACDACPRGGSVRVSASADVAGVTFVVTDDGAGIAPENAARVTEPFFTTKADGKGTGLGLAVTQEIVKSHRGMLAIEPASPRGTRASLTIPTSQGGPDARA